MKEGRRETISPASDRAITFVSLRVFLWFGQTELATESKSNASGSAWLDDIILSLLFNYERVEFDYCPLR